MKQLWQPSKIKRARKIGFRARMATKGRTPRDTHAICSARQHYIGDEKMGRKNAPERLKGGFR